MSEESDLMPSEFNDTTGLIGERWLMDYINEMPIDDLNLAIAFKQGKVPIEVLYHS